MPEIFDGSASPLDDEPQQTPVADLVQELFAHSNPFGSFSPQPEKVCFDIQMHGEKVLLLMRQHPVTQIGKVVTALFLSILPLFFGSVPFLNFLPLSLAGITLVAWYMLVFGFVLESFLSWFYNVYIITDQRIIDADFYSLLNKNVATAQIERIEDVTITHKGYLGSIFDYGTILIQTAGAVDQFEFNDAPHPSRVSAFLNDLFEKKGYVRRKKEDA